MLSDNVIIELYEFCDWLDSLELFMCKMWNYETCYITNVYLCVWILGIEWEAFDYGNIRHVPPGGTGSAAKRLIM